jgi:hypothetical protein
MRNRVLFVAALLALFAGIGMFSIAADDKPKFTIKEIMEKAHKGDPALCKKVVTEKASKDEKKQLLDYYTALSQNKPPKGDMKDWKERTDALVSAAKAAVAEDKDYGAKVKTALNCKGCHDLHKGK